MRRSTPSSCLLVVALFLVTVAGCSAKGTWRCDNQYCTYYLLAIETLRAGTVPKGHDYKTCPKCMRQGTFMQDGGDQYGG